MRISLSILHLTISVSFLVFLYLFQISHYNYHKGKNTKPRMDFRTVWTDGQGVELVIWWLQVKALLSATHWNSSHLPGPQLLGCAFHKAPRLLPDGHVHSLFHSLFTHLLLLSLKSPTGWWGGWSIKYTHIYSCIPTYVHAYRLKVLTLFWNWT